ncbi:glycerophosphodiester phosphodiesterase [Ruania halotolerans]|uniref:glycerophosphodiester phosphodiesterase n=1 Tax=Ruania halotolerans TaxID=2897773 RepID=UPI001E537DB8|nr:glycerophosphodiester phosphodiesterase family protein [Ruania halotolerans]UFU07028.1 glycerophosphodiester phosphodiesterase [Ruania halotolerans]
MTQIIAHRGNSAVAPENTLPAFAAAAFGGSDFIEIDLQVGGDGSAVVIHDASVDRTTDGAGIVAEMLATDMKYLDAGSWFDPAFAGTALPLFADVVDLLGRFPEVGLLLELKGAWRPEPTMAVLTQIREAGLTERVLAQSFEVDMLRTLQTLAPDLPRALLVREITGEALTTCAELGAVACNPSSASVIAEPSAVARVHDAGQQIFTWTSNDPDEWAPLVAAGVDGIITDRPDRLAGWLATQ